MILTPPVDNRAKRLPHKLLGDRVRESVERPAQLGFTRPEGMWKLLVGTKAGDIAVITDGIFSFSAR